MIAGLKNCGRSARAKFGVFYLIWVRVDKGTASKIENS
ncbi:hypothetical protein ABIB40_000418 [Pedobacter sp. UYP30]